MVSDLAVLYEDSDIVAVAKPAGVETPATEEWFRNKYPEATLERPYVHRLDRDTSGVLLFAKNQEAYDFYRAAFHDRAVEKTYLAIVYGAPKEKRGKIDFDIGRSRKDFRLRSAQPKARGRLRDAVTRYEVVGETPGYAALLVRPLTGRTHQIRVHLKAIHHPILGDPLYAPKRENALGLERLALHAYALDLPLPRRSESREDGRLIITAPVPPDFAAALAHFPGLRERFAADTA